MGISSASIFPARKREAVSSFPLHGEENVKGWKAKMDHERIQDIFTYNKNDTIAYHLDCQQMNLNSLHSIYIYYYY